MKMPHIPDTLNIIVVCMMGLLLLMLWVETLRRNRVGRLREENERLKSLLRHIVPVLDTIRKLHPCDDPRCASSIADRTLKELSRERETASGMPQHTGQQQQRAVARS